ncbi:MAG: zinc ribbon domain-containing protein [Candidatus Anstonellales archaeon]
MGILELLLGQKKKGIPLVCQNCKEKIDSSLERCPRCGVHLSSMFRIKCPRCGEPNELDAKKCKKCGYSFEAPPSPPITSVRYTCPRCGYVADYYMLSCPACGVRFV